MLPVSSNWCFWSSKYRCHPILSVLWDALLSFNNFSIIEPGPTLSSKGNRRLAWGREEFWAEILKPNFLLFRYFLVSFVSVWDYVVWIKMDGRKQENTEKVRSLVLKFLPKILLCLTGCCDCLSNSMWPQKGQPTDDRSSFVRFTVFGIIVLENLAP